LLALYGFMAAEYDYRPADVSQLPYADFALGLARTQARRLLHSYGALRCLERLLGLLHPQGFILANDYGPTPLQHDAEYEHQRFSQATFIGVNFPELKAYFGDGGKCRFLEPPGDSESIHSRLLGHAPALETRTRFLERFGKPAQDWRQEPVQKARESRAVGRLEAEATHYREALRRQPGSWVLLNEVSMFLIFTLRDVKAGIDLAKLALGLNPTCSAEVWNTLGDGLYEWGRDEEAGSAYRRALQISPQGVRARYNLGWGYPRQKDYGAALARTAPGVGLDPAREDR